jgi:hypothetical protein
MLPILDYQVETYARHQKKSQNGKTHLAFTSAYVLISLSTLFTVHNLHYHQPPHGCCAPVTILLDGPAPPPDQDRSCSKGASFSDSFWLSPPIDQVYSAAKIHCPAPPPDQDFATLLVAGF